VAGQSLHPFARSYPPALFAPAFRSRAVAAGASFVAISALAAFTVFHAQTSESHAQTEGAASLSAAALASCPVGMIEIPGATFAMGSNDDLEIEKPAHRVTLGRYCVDRFEVTTRDYVSCSDRGECLRAGKANAWSDIHESERTLYDPLCNARDPDGRAAHPINCVTWENAAAYCASAGKRLPTEAEWELAARGPDGNRYPWGNEPPNAKLLNACGKECSAWQKKNRLDGQAMHDGDDGWVHTAPVGSFPRGASRYGVEDVVGNVWEWVADWYAPYTTDALDNPKGPKEGEEGRVIRGGAWNGARPDWVRPTFRYHDAPEKRSYGIGFRCAK
jgi:formylglycine-generating enzyme required for sulfatase activity